jgi:hypothetical protein
LDSVLSEGIVNDGDVSLDSIRNGGGALAGSCVVLSEGIVNDGDVIPNPVLSEGIVNGGGDGLDSVVNDGSPGVDNEGCVDNEGDRIPPMYPV